LLAIVKLLRNIINQESDTAEINKLWRIEVYSITKYLLALYTRFCKRPGHLALI